jgi:uncharacterized repeat protein (TIGR01451 family)
MAFGVSFCAREKWSEKPTNTKTLVFNIVVLAGLVAMCATTPLLAQSPGFTDFSSATNLTPLGNAVVPFNNGSANILRLNPDQTSQVGAAWFNIKQPVANGFTTTFTFQITHAGFPADGIAFVIQNAPAGVAALGGGGGNIGYNGIPNSLAVEFDTYANGGPGPNNDPNANHVGVQSCGTFPNSADHGATYNVGDSLVPCNLALNSNLILPNEGFLSDQNQHTATISYTPPSASCVSSCFGVLNVVLDTVNLFPDGVPVNLATLLSLDHGTAYVGFTGATGAANEANDIVSWNFSPTTVTQPLQAGVLTTFNFGSYLYKVRPDQNIDALSVTAVLTDPIAFGTDRTTLNNFPGAQCIIYSGTAGKCVEFHAACTSSNGACTNVNYDVITSYDVPSGQPINPGFLKATGLDCALGIAFDSNIITAFTQTRTDPTTKGKSKPSFSCFVAVQGVIYQQADLDIVNLASPKVKPNSNLTYVATVANFGPSGAQGVAISNPIPAGTSYVSSALCSLTNGCSNTSCTFDGTTASCGVGNLDKFGLEFLVVTVKVTAPVGTIISDTATVTAFNPDSDTKPDRSWTMKTIVSNSNK